MIRLTTLYASGAGVSAAYYTGYLTKADGEQPGVWAGSQARGLGLTGEVTTEALEALLSGHHPTTGMQLGRALEDRVDRHGNTIKAVAGYDATLSAPKSLSALWGLTGDDGVAECHDVAVNAVVAMIERYGSTTRIRSNGSRLHPETQGLTVGVFRQSTSRADDPQLHTHVVISSKVQTADGRWYALDALMLKKYQQAFGYLYQRAGRMHRRSARRDVEAASDVLAVATDRLTRAEELATPTRRRVDELRNVIDDHHRMDWTRKMFDDFNDLEGVAYDAGRLCHALDEWKHWANGRNLDNTALAEIAATLRDHDDRPGISQLAAPLTQWAQRRGLELQPPTPTTPTRSSMGIEIGF